MNPKSIYKPLLIIITFIGIIKISYAQGLNIYIGSSSLSNESALITPESMIQSGFLIGAEGRLNEGNMYFIAGLQFHSIGEIPVDNYSFNPPGEKFNITKIRGGLGYELFSLGQLIVFRGKSLASLDILNNIEPSQQINYNETIAGIVLGLGMDVSFISLDIELELGLVNAINQVDKSKYDFLNINLGVIF